MWELARSTHPEALPLFIIYDRPADFPDHVVMRLWLSNQPGARAWTFDSVARARQAVPEGLVCMARDACDEPHIVESWL